MTTKQAEIAAKLIVAKFIFEVTDPYIMHPEKVDLNAACGLDVITLDESLAITEEMNKFCDRLTKGHIRFNSFNDIVKYARSF
jgi:hypothetical protein